MPATSGYANVFTPPQPTPDAINDALCKILNSRWDQSSSWYRTVRQDSVEWYKSYKAMTTFELASYKNNVAIPLAHAIVQSDLARKVSSLFGAWPIVDFEGFEVGGKEFARKTSLLVSSQLKERNSFMKGLEFLTNADVFGTGIARVGWKNIKRLKLVRQQWLDKVYAVRQPVTLYNGPDWDNISVPDAAPQPGKKRVEDMRWFMYRYYVDFDDLQSMNGGPVPMFDPAAILKLREHPLQGDGAKEYYGRFLFNRPGAEADAMRMEEYAKPVCIKEMVGFVPSEFAPDGITMRIITMANDSVILRNDPNPFDNDQIPIVACSPVHDTDDFFGISKVYLVQKLQAASNRLLNVRLDVLDQFANPMWMGDSTKIPSNQNMNAKPGRIFLTRGNPSEVLMPLVPNLQGFQASHQEFEFLYRFMQLATGMIEESMMGTGGNRQTAREYLGKQEAVLNRVALEAMVCSYEFLEPLANWFHTMNRAWLPLPQQLKIIGGSALINEITGLPYPTEPPAILAGELDHDYRARAVGPMMMLTKTSQRADTMQLLQIMQANPVFMQMVNWANFAKKIFSIYDWDSSEMLVSQVPQINQFAAAQGMSPEDFLSMAGGMGGASGQQLGTVDPQILQNQNPNAALGVGP